MARDGRRFREPRDESTSSYASRRLVFLYIPWVFVPHYLRSDAKGVMVAVLFSLQTIYSRSMDINEVLSLYFELSLIVYYT